MSRFLLTLLMLVAACGGSALESPTSSSGSGPTTTTADASDTTTAGSPGTSETGTTSGSSDETTTTASDLPLAPDFTLELGTGGEYRLTDTDNPVYLVFWAEW